MKSIINAFMSLTRALGSFGAIAVYFLIGIGGIYWLWIAIQIGSFWMFIVGLFPLFYIVTAPVGAWSLLFGVPSWVFSLFG
ncbi:hypothetical protein [Vreelandella titanicae]|uniref:hypothetical protein n=1 Tax=Vreelandella titanicae TaxID=664683 RepID=UPI0037F26AD5